MQSRYDEVFVIIFSVRRTSKIDATTLNIPMKQGVILVEFGHLIPLCRTQGPTGGGIEATLLYRYYKIINIKLMYSLLYIKLAY